MDKIAFQPIVPFWLLAIIFLMGLLMLLIGPSFVKLSGPRRLTLTLIRFGLLLMAMVAAVRPGCVDKIQKTQTAVLMFLLDSSRSMELPHVKDDSTRWGELQRSIRDNQGRFNKLTEKGIECRFFSFHNQLSNLEINDGQIVLPDKPGGSETDIGSSLYQSIVGVREERVLGVVLMSDGNQNVSDPEIELQQSVQNLSDMEVPLFAVPFGLPGDTGQLADLAITNFAEQHVVNVKNDLTARATLVARGYANQQIKVDLVQIDGTGAEKIVQTTFVTPNSSHYEKNVELVYRPTAPGESRIKIRANPMPGELAIRNNELEGFLTVNDKGMRILMVVGDLNWEQSKLRESLSVNDFMQIDFLEINPSTYRNWPLNQYEEVFKDSAYDLFIFIDIDSLAFHKDERYTATLDAVAEAVLKGKGLVMLGGYHSFGAGGYAQTPLADILPVKMRPGERQDFNRNVDRELHINKPIKLRPSMDHFITRIGDNENRLTAWQKLPPLVGANRIEVKDNALVLLESDDEVKRPVLAVTEVGGRVAAFAGDSTYRWKMRGMKEYDQFWRQMILWLAKWDQKNDESVSIILPQRRFQPKSKVKFNVVVNTAVNANPAEKSDIRFEGLVRLPNGEAKKISVIKAGESYLGEIDPELIDASGLYRIEIKASRGENAIGNTSREFIVIDRDKEKSNPVANPEQLDRLAKQTAEHGGRALVPEELPKLLDDLIENPPMSKIEIPIKSRFGDRFGESAAFLLFFVGLLTVEWFLRKKWGLV